MEKPAAHVCFARPTTLASVALSCAVLAAGCPAGSRCPAEYPVERDGFCYAADGGAMLDTGPTDAGGLDSGRVDGGGTGTDTGGTGTDGGGGTDVPATDGGVLCTGTHPLVEGDRRYCIPGECFCADPDACFPADTADACCPGPIVCSDADAGGSVICTGTHPIVEGGRRFCEPGDCFCADPDACFPADTADACCPGPVVCG